MKPQLENGAARAEGGAGALATTMALGIVANGHHESEPLDEAARLGEERRLMETASSGSITAPPLPSSPVRSFVERMKDPAEREQLRRRIEETPELLGEIAADYDISVQRLSKYRSRQGWTRRHPDAPSEPRALDGTPISRKRGTTARPNTERVTSRLLGLVDRQIGKLGGRLKRKEAIVDEKDARILSTLAKTMQTLMALERGDGALGNKPEPVDIDEYRSELARRIRRWAEGGEESGRAAEETDSASA